MGKKHHTRTAEKWVKWTARRLEVEYERVNRTCACPPHLPHANTCEFAPRPTPTSAPTASSSAASSSTTPDLTTGKRFDFKKAAGYFAQKAEGQNCNFKVSLSDSDEEQEEEQKEQEEKT